ncbi:hypothetical protein [Collimonas antrihumi]|uniref:hypothetical protein n=1 Tax=Collimonas antrihumi TaxID=1940615 RepID=UPI001B8C33FA|nr:hypothetical protein [Collimonas antrihumi]
MNHDQLITKLANIEECATLTVGEVCQAMTALGAGYHNMTFTDNDGEPVLVIAMAHGVSARRLDRTLKFVDTMTEKEE